MKGATGGFIKILLLPFTALGYIFKGIKKPIYFIIDQSKKDKLYLKRRDEFIKQRKKHFKLNDELI